MIVILMSILLGLNLYICIECGVSGIHILNLIASVLLGVAILKTILDDY